MQEKYENFTSTISRLKEYAIEQCISMNQIAIKIGVSNSYFSKMAKNNGLLGEDIIRKILLYYENINSEWLLTGKGPMLRDRQTIKDVSNSTIIGNVKGNANKISHTNASELSEQLRVKDEQIARLFSIIDNLSEK